MQAKARGVIVIAQNAAVVRGAEPDGLPAGAGGGRARGRRDVSTAPARSSELELARVDWPRLGRPARPRTPARARRTASPTRKKEDPRGDHTTH